MLSTFDATALTFPAPFVPSAPAPARPAAARRSTQPAIYDETFDYAASLAAYRAGDQAAARELVEQLHPLVIGIVRARLSRRTPEEDVAQEIFLKVFSKLDQYRGEVPFPHWVARIAGRTCIDHLRLWKRRPEFRLADLSEEEADAVDRTLTTENQTRPNDALVVRELLDRLIGELSPRDQLVIQLLDLEQRSLAEIEAITGWNRTVTKVRAFRARRKLQARYRELRAHERA